MDMGFSEIIKNLGSELLEKAKSMEKISDVKDLDKPLAKMLDNTGKYDSTEIANEKLEPNSKYEIDGDSCETDDNGNIYKKNGDLLPDTTYEVNGVKYTTDEQGRITSWEGKPKYAPENERDEEAQTEAGGEDRQEGDDGGHLMARILGGSSGNENIVPMRGTINKGDYKKSENEIVNAVKPNDAGQSKDVQDSGTITYEGESSRPSKIERTYVIDGEKSVLKVDNVEGSKDLLDDVKENISDEDMSNLNDEIADMEEDGCEVSVTSVLNKYDKDGNLVSVRVGVRNETTGEKTYHTYDAKKG